MEKITLRILSWFVFLDQLNQENEMGEVCKMGEMRNAHKI
jgi:hypothetical protein